MRCTARPWPAARRTCLPPSATTPALVGYRWATPRTPSGWRPRYGAGFAARGLPGAVCTSTTARPFISRQLGLVRCSASALSLASRPTPGPRQDRAGLPHRARAVPGRAEPAAAPGPGGAEPAVRRLESKRSTTTTHAGPVKPPMERFLAGAPPRTAQPRRAQGGVLVGRAPPGHQAGHGQPVRQPLPGRPPWSARPWS